MNASYWERVKRYIGAMTPTVDRKLDGRSLRAVANYIASDKCKNVFVLVGAGISTSAGIPDFRSPETGLYANLAKYDLPYPEAVFAIDFFRENPKPFYALAKELEPGKFRPTLTHSFIRLLAEKKLLHTCFTQNIDTLERRAGVPAKKIIEAHGSFATHSCITCKRSFSDDKMMQHIAEQKVPICEREGCGGLVKPNIVFFGEGLPPAFFSSIGTLEKADLVIIAGTSLTVSPFSMLPQLCPDDCPRLLINLERVGDIGSRVNDVVEIGECDIVVRNLTDALGWTDELDALWEATASPEEGVAEGPDETATEESLDQKIEKQVDDITKAVEDSLKISDRHKETVLSELDGRGKDEPDALSAPQSDGKDRALPKESSESKKTDGSTKGSNL